VDAIWKARALEWIRDHARNIYEHVINFVEGVDSKHISLAQIEKEISIEQTVPSPGFLLFSCTDNQTGYPF